MGAVWGNKVRYTIFGESHGPAIGIVIDGLPAGTRLDQDYIRQEMLRRAPGYSELSTPRQETDAVEIISGVYNNYTDGSPLCALIKNTNTRSGDYAVAPRIFRPGHADYTGFVKYQGYNDPRGGGHFSGRLTAPLVFAGALVKSLLAERQIVIGAHIVQVGPVEDDYFDPVLIAAPQLTALRTAALPVLNPTAAEQMRQEILTAKQEQDSIGGVVEAAVVGVPPGVGEPFFDSVESVLAQLLFAIPAVKGVEFGAGFGVSTLRASQANDSMNTVNGNVTAATNYQGGIAGGITNGMPIVVRVAFKPTPSIAKCQQTVDETGAATVLAINGRHDPCIVPRAVPVVEALTALAIWDLI